MIEVINPLTVPMGAQPTDFQKGCWLLCLQQDVARGPQARHVPWKSGVKWWIYQKLMDWPFGKGSTNASFSLSMLVRWRADELMSMAFLDACSLSDMFLFSVMHCAKRNGYGQMVLVHRSHKPGQKNRPGVIIQWKVLQMSSPVKMPYGSM